MNALRVGSAGRERLNSSAGDKKRIGKLLFDLSINERSSIQRNDTAAGSSQHCVSGGGIPFHGAAETWINVGFSCGNQAEF